MSIKDKAYRLFSYISQVYSIDLPVIHDVSEHKAELWWQADLTHSEQCKIKEFDIECNAQEEITGEAITEDAWLSVTKRPYDQPPDLPDILKDWINLSFNPNKKPSPKPSLQKIIPFDADTERATAFKKYNEAWKEWKKSNERPMPPIPEVLNDWLEELKPEDEGPRLINEHKFFQKKYDGFRKNVFTIYH